MDKLRKLLEAPLELAVVISGVSLLAYYTLYARKKIMGDIVCNKTQGSSLDLPLSTLLNRKDNKICKIVFSESAGSQSSFRGELLTRLKQFLISTNHTVLVNCSPLKLFDASIEIFRSTLSKDDAEDQKQFMSYFANALKCELIIQRTIIDIQQIRNVDSLAFLLCDTNTIDLKVQADKQLWTKFLEANKIEENKLRENYQIVFHVLGSDCISSPKIGARKYSNTGIKQEQKSDDQKIKDAWKGFQKYYPIQYNPDLTQEQNYQKSLIKMVGALQDYLPKETVYKKQPYKEE